MTRAIRRVCGALGALALVLGLGGCSAGVVPAVHSEPERFELARRAMARRDYTVAIELLKTYVANNGGSRDVDEAVYRLGQCYLAVKEYPSAQVEFERLVRDYPESDSAGSASFRLGEALFAQTRPRDFDQEYTHKALQQWQDYLAGYPGHWLNDTARRRVAEAQDRLAAKLLDAGHLYLKLRLPGPARVYFQRVLSEYPNSSSVAAARAGIAECDARMGGGGRPEPRRRVDGARPDGEPVRADRGPG